MQVDMSRYPANWSEIARRIKERDGWRCKWCGVPHGAYITGDLNSSVWYVAADERLIQDGRAVRVILTTAHLGAPRADGTPGDKRDKMDVRDENLAALCQRCHLLYDLDEHMHNAAITRARKAKEAAREAGQIEMEP